MLGKRVNLPHLCVQVSPCTSKHDSPGAQNSASGVGSSLTCSILSNIAILPFSPLHLQVPQIWSWEPWIPKWEIPGKNRRIEWPRGEVEVEVARPWSLTTQMSKGRCVNKIHRTWGYKRPRYTSPQIVNPPPRCPFLWCRATPSCPVASSTTILHKETINEMVRSILLWHNQHMKCTSTAPNMLLQLGKSNTEGIPTCQNVESTMIPRLP